MTDTRIAVVHKHPGMEPKLVVVDNELHALQTLVDGYIEIACYFYGANGSKFAVVVDEEGMLKNKPNNILYPYMIGLWKALAGDVFIVRIEGEEFVDMDSEDLAYCFSWMKEQMSI